MSSPERKNQLDAFTEAGLSGLPVERINGRVVHSRGREFIDYCTTNYLGWDFDPRLHLKGAEFGAKWGSLTGWSRLEADPHIYSDLEKRISNFLGVKDTILSHTITITNFSVMSAIAGKGVIFTDAKVHTVVYEAARLARDHGAQLVRFNHQDPSDLLRKLEQYKDVHPKLIAVDGVYSISTAQAPVLALQKICRDHGAWLYVDDAHGFGVLGQGGRGVVHAHGGDHDRTFYVSSFGKAFCTHTAFLTIPHEYTVPLRERCMQYIYSAPMTPHVVGMVNAAMDLNESEGDAQRARLGALCEEFVAGLREMKLDVLNESHFPVVFWKLGSQAATIAAAHGLLEGGVLAGLRAYPVVPESECGFRFGLTALHTREQIQKTLAVIRGLPLSVRPAA